jgi:putative membrane-bound dehydrogenase-like protein
MSSCLRATHTLPLALLITLVATGAIAQQSPDESLATLHPADGLAVSLWASEPMVNNPTAMDIDSRGRVWIAEGLNYRMSQKKHETLRKDEQADRIKILTDTDGDGRADKVTVFADKIFPVPLGLAVEEIWKDGKYQGARVYVGNAPDLLVLEDTDGDDRADRRYPLLTGFRGIDSDHGLHGMALGPDGRMYFTVGDARYGADKVNSLEPTFDVTDKSGRRVSASHHGTVLRVDLDGKNLEVLAYGLRNNYEATIDSFGNVFSSDNDDDGNRGSRTAWIMEGGQYGYHDPRSSRHWAEEFPGIIPKIVGTGNGAPGGLTVYEGALLPPECFQAVLQVDAGTRQLNMHPLMRHGAGFRSDYKVLLKGDDSWFRPVDVSVAPDGSVFVCDWYDAGVGGNRFSDQTTGRIYRLAPSGVDAKPQSNRPDFGSTAGLVAALQSPNVSTRFTARQTLLMRGSESRVALQKLFRDGHPHQRARALFVLADLPETGKADVVAALKDVDPRIRETALQILARDASRESVVGPESARNATPPAVTVLADILPLVNDPDAGVRRALLMALRNVSSNLVSDAFEQLAASWDGRDRYYLEALRAALKNRDSAFVDELFDALAIQAISQGWNNGAIAMPPYFPITTNDAFLRPDDQLAPANAASKVIGLAWVLERPEAINALRRLLKKNDSHAIDQAADIALSRIADPQAGKLLVERYVAAGEDRGRQRELLKRLGSGVAGPWGKLRGNEKLQTVIDSAFAQGSLRVSAIQMIARAELEGYDERMLSLARDESADRVARAAAIEALGKRKYERVGELASQLVEQAKNQPRGGLLSVAALVAISNLSVEDAQSFLTEVIVDSQYPLDLRRRALQTIVARPVGVNQMVALHERDKFPSELLSELTFLLHNHADRGVRRTATEAFPLPKTGSGKSLENLNVVLAMPADAERGRVVFHQNKDTACSRCHRVQGEGSWVGPDLSSIGIKYGKKELLYHILNPSGAINYNFVSHMIVLDDGRILSGLIVGRDDSKLVLKTANGDRQEIPIDQIDEQQALNVSLMPADLVAKLTEENLADLLEYLSTLRKPVSTANEYYVIGPLSTEPLSKDSVPDLHSSQTGSDGGEVRWQRITAETDGRLDVSDRLGSREGRFVVSYLPINSPNSQKARIVINSEASITVQLNGKAVAIDRRSDESSGSVLTASLLLQRGVNHLLVRLTSGGDAANITTTLITDREISYSF